jgi:hypothetical protein
LIQIKIRIRRTMDYFLTRRFLVCYDRFNGMKRGVTKQLAKLFLSAAEQRRHALSAGKKSDQYTRILMPLDIMKKPVR